MFDNIFDAGSKRSAAKDYGVNYPEGFNQNFIEVAMPRINNPEYGSWGTRERFPTLSDTPKKKKE